jgi:hypothetical protein
MTAPKTKTQKRRRRTVEVAEKYTKSDPIPPQTEIVERVKWLADTGHRPGHRFMSSGGNLVERTHSTLFHGTPQLPEGIVTGGFQILEKDNDGKEIRSSHRYDISTDQIMRLRAHAHGIKYTTAHERLKWAHDKDQQTSTAPAEKSDDVFEQMVALAKDDPKLLAALVKAWAERGGSNATPGKELKYGDLVGDGGSLPSSERA